MNAAAVTIASALAGTADRLRAARVDTARRDARLLVAHALKADVAVTVGYGERLLDCYQQDRLRRALGRRVRREPMAHITGRREFWSLDFEVCRDVLTPRPESETLVEAALARITDRTCGLRILDLGTGSGCLLLALLHEFPAATGIGVDVCEKAATVAQSNARRLGLDRRAAFVVGDWAGAFHASFNIVVANPPYIWRDDVQALAPEVSVYEPVIALDGGTDGAGAYRRLAPQLASLLAANAFAVVEIGAEQARKVSAIFETSGMRVDQVCRDLAGTERCLVLGPMR